MSLAQSSIEIPVTRSVSILKQMRTMHVHGSADFGGRGWKTIKNG
jgi:hypothetical protein